MGHRWSVEWVIHVGLKEDYRQSQRFQSKIQRSIIITLLNYIPNVECAVEYIGLFQFVQLGLSIKYLIVDAKNKTKNPSKLTNERSLLENQLIRCKTQTAIDCLKILVAGHLLHAQW